MTERYQKEIVQRITRNLLDIQILRLIRTEPGNWGYKIKKTVEADANIKLGHGNLYPLLKDLEQKGFLASEKQREKGRARKIYTVTDQGERYLQAYYAIISEQLEKTKKK